MSKQLIIKTCWECPYRKTKWSKPSGRVHTGTSCEHPDRTVKYINLDNPSMYGTHKDCPMDDYNA